MTALAKKKKQLLDGNVTIVIHRFVHVTLLCFIWHDHGNVGIVDF